MQIGEFASDYIEVRRDFTAGFLAYDSEPKHVGNGFFDPPFTEGHAQVDTRHHELSHPVEKMVGGQANLETILEKTGDGVPLPSE